MEKNVAALFSTQHNGRYNNITKTDHTCQLHCLR